MENKNLKYYKYYIPNFLKIILSNRSTVGQTCTNHRVVMLLYKDDGFERKYIF